MHFLGGWGEEDFAVFIPTCGLSCSTTQPHPTMTGALTRFSPLLLLILLISEDLQLLLFTEPTSPFALS